MSRILVLYTGGTIGMDHTPEGLAPAPGLLPRLLQRFERPGLAFDVIEFEQLIDSSAVTPRQWNQIIDALVSRYPDYDGFVVIHGTDTMAYTASVLSFALQGLSKPVVLTGAQLPLVHPRSDGWANLADALEAACQPDLNEVAIAFDRLLLRGNRARKLDAERFDGFNSPNAEPLAQFAIHAHWRRERWLKPEGEWRPTRINENLKLAALMLTPGHGSALAGMALQAGGLDGAILLAYGSGNAPADPVLLSGIEAMKARGCPVLTLTQVMKGAVEVGAYAASQPLARAGAWPGGDLTPEAALGKLQVLLSGSVAGEALREAMSRALRGEMTV
ncbi:asparaginase [Chromobacterium sp. IIBBL 290-4]|uniref:asparaginase n=1 Tax=Chromobacterium sp. IIBBL 290-4 TaxID=2953890 RepID=UPI0020B715F7|nr:asparaginase [Chromobacterium sp. IIBBL 290-4]UTH72854.1 asparaginase [Chromobacterium sp. IIBBL 290-4]